MTNLPLECIATRHFSSLGEGREYRENIATPLVIDDDQLTEFYLRINAKEPGLYTMSIMLDLQNSGKTETVSIANQLQVIFEKDD